MQLVKRLSSKDLRLREQHSEMKIHQGKPGLSFSNKYLDGSDNISVYHNNEIRENKPGGGRLVGENDEGGSPTLSSSKFWNILST